MNQELKTKKPIQPVQAIARPVGVAIEDEAQCSLAQPVEDQEEEQVRPVEHSSEAKTAKPKPA